MKVGRYNNYAFNFKAGSIILSEHSMSYSSQTIAGDGNQLVTDGARVVYLDTMYQRLDTLQEVKHEEKSQAGNGRDRRTL